MKAQSPSVVASSRRPHLVRPGVQERAARALAQQSASNQSMRSAQTIRRAPSSTEVQDFDAALQAARWQMALVGEPAEQGGWHEEAPTLSKVTNGQAAQALPSLDELDALLNQDLQSLPSQQGQFELLLPGDHCIAVTYDTGLHQTHVLLQPRSRALTKKLKPYEGELSTRISQRRGQNVHVMVI